MATDVLAQREADLLVRNRAIDEALAGRQARAAPTAAPQQLERAVQEALQELLGAAGLGEEDQEDEDWPAADACAPSGLSSAALGPPTRRTGEARAQQQRTAHSSRRQTAPGTEAPSDPLLLVQDSEEGGALPPAAAARLYRARLKALSAELATAQAAAQQRQTRLAATEREAAVLRTERAAWVKAQAALEQQVERHRRAAEDAKAALSERQARCAAQERRSAEGEVRAREARLASALEEAGRLRRLLEEARRGAPGKGGSGSCGAGGGAEGVVSREEHARVAAEARTLAAQKAELAAGFRKAMRLVDVLRRQRVHLEAAALLQVSSRELGAVLEGGGSSSAASK